MPSICLSFRVHQPQWLKHYTFFDIDNDHIYEDVERNQRILNELSGKLYLPANRILLSLIKRHKGAFRFSFSITGILLDQFEKHRIDVLDSFKRLADTGCVEFINETHCHSLAFLFSVREFKEQVMLHKKKIMTLFGQTPRTFRHTEFIYNNELAKAIEKMGYYVIMAEGADKVLGWRSPNHVYRPAGCTKLKLLFRNHRLSSDFEPRFPDSKGSYHLTADKYADRIRNINDSGDVINLFIDYKTFGENRSGDARGFELIRLLAREISRNPDFRFHTPSEVAKNHDPVACLDVADLIAPVDAQSDFNAWLGNSLQKDAVNVLYNLEMKVRRRKDGGLLHTWRMLQESEHFRCMDTGGPSDGDALKRSNPYGSPYDAYINYMNIIDDFSGLLGKKRSVVNEAV